MTEELQGVESADIKDQTVETPETETVEETGEQPPETVEVEETVEEKLARLEKAVEAKDTLIKRQRASLASTSEAYQRELARLRELEASVQKQEEALPNPDDFDTNEEYVKALAKEEAKRIVEQERIEASRMQAQMQAQKMAMERTRIANEQEAEYVRVNPSYAQAKELFGEFVTSSNIPKEVEAAIVEQAFEGNIPKLIDYFAGDDGARLSELERISSLPPMKAVIEIYKIQQKLVSAPSKTETKQAPKPVNVPKSGASVNNRPTDKDDVETWMKKRAKQIRS